MHPSIEALESRIAPAAVFSYTESDGDVITIKTTARISNADFASYIANNAHFSDGPGVGNLEYLNLDDPVFRNTSLTISAVQSGSGTGKAQIGEIDAEVDLKNVVIAGDLGSLDVGDYNHATVGLTKLQVDNLGYVGEQFDDSDFRGGVKTINILGNLHSEISVGNYEEGNGVGTLGTIKVTGSVTENGSILARKIGTLVVGGDMGGLVESENIKSVRIGGNLVGTYNDTGSIYADSIKSIRITGSILGGDAYSGGISADVIGNVTVGGNIEGGDGGHSGYIYGDDEIGKVIVLGDLIGGAGDMSGIIESEGEVGLIRIDGNVVAGAGDLSGSIALVYHDESYIEDYYDEELDRWVYDVEMYDFYTEGHVSKIVIGGSLIGAVEVEVEPELTELVGGSASGSVIASSIGSLRIGGNVAGGIDFDSGTVRGDSLGSAYIGGSLIGGSGLFSGSVDFGGIGNLRIVGSVIGGEAPSSGSILTYDGIGSVKIGGDLTGGNGEGSGSIGVQFGAIDSIVIGGSLSSSTDLEEGNTGIYAGGSISRITIGGAVTGGEYGTLNIRAGYEHPANSSVPSIGTVTVKGDVTNLLIEAGISIFGDVNPDASIGSINIKGNFNNSSIVAGLSTGDDEFYGNDENELPYDNDLTVVSRIASVVIGGTVTGTEGGLDSYGIFAQHIVAAKINGQKVGLLGGASNDLVTALSGTGDFRLVEIGALPIAEPI